MFKVDLVQHLPKADPGAWICPLESCWGSQMHIEGCAGAQSYVQQLFYHHRKSNLWRKKSPCWFVWFSLESDGPLGSLLFHSSVKKPHFGTSQFFQPRRAWPLLLACSEAVAQEQNEAFLSRTGCITSTRSWGQRNRSWAGREILCMAAHYVSAEMDHPILHSVMKRSSQVIGPAISKFNKLPVWLADRINSSMMSA